MTSNNGMLNKSDIEHKYWIHKVDGEIKESIEKNKILGSKFSQRSNVKYLLPNHEIIFLTKFNDSWVFYGYTKVESIFKDSNDLYGHYNNRIKLNIKRIKYFLNPILLDDIYDDLSFIKNKENYLKYIYSSEYREISKEDANLIKQKSLSTGMYPVYFDFISKDLKDFILESMKSLHVILCKIEKRSQIEIDEFIWLLKDFLVEYGINKDFNDLKRFYSRYAHELGFKHNPSRSSENFVVLMTPDGKKKNFAYISLE